MSDIFVEVFPYYLSIGMSYEEFWHGEHWLCEAYRKADKIKANKRNEEMWLQGYYNFYGVSTAISNMHFDDKSHTVNKYLDKPIDIFPKTEAEIKAEQEKQNRNTVAFLNQLKADYDRRQERLQANDT